MLRSPGDYRREFALLTEEELAIMLEVKLDTVRSWRSEKIGPKWTKLGKSVYYRALDVSDWINDCVVSTNSPQVSEAA